MKQQQYCNIVQSIQFAQVAASRFKSPRYFVLLSSGDASCPAASPQQQQHHQAIFCVLLLNEPWLHCLCGSWYRRVQGIGFHRIVIFTTINLVEWQRAPSPSWGGPEGRQQDAAPRAVALRAWDFARGCEVDGACAASTARHRRGQGEHLHVENMW